MFCFLCGAHRPPLRTRATPGTRPPRARWHARRRKCPSKRLCLHPARTREGCAPPASRRPQPSEHRLARLDHRIQDDNPQPRWGLAPRYPLGRRPHPPCPHRRCRCHRSLHAAHAPRALHPDTSQPQGSRPSRNDLPSLQLGRSLPRQSHTLSHPTPPLDRLPPGTLQRPDRTPHGARQASPSPRSADPRRPLRPRA